MKLRIGSIMITAESYENLEQELEDTKVKLKCSQVKASLVNGKPCGTC